MIVIIVPLLLYRPILKWHIRGSYEMGEEMAARLINREPSFSPDHPMAFEEEPLEVGKLSATGVKLK